MHYQIEEKYEILNIASKIVNNFLGIVANYFIWRKTDSDRFNLIATVIFVAKNISREHTSRKTCVITCKT